MTATRRRQTPAPRRQNPEAKVFTASEVASIFHVSTSFVCKMAQRDGHFHGVRVIRIGRRVLFSRVAIERVLAEFERAA